MILYMVYGWGSAGMVSEILNYLDFYEVNRVGQAHASLVGHTGQCY